MKVRCVGNCDVWLCTLFTIVGLRALGDARVTVIIRGACAVRDYDSVLEARGAVIFKVDFRFSSGGDPSSNSILVQ